MSPDLLLRLADQCVKCGVCLPHCPTFAQLANEADSPRGRIALVQGWASGALRMTPTLAAHLDGCLHCRACERACPSLVQFGRLADGAKAARVSALPGWRRALRRARLAALSDARVTAWLARIASLYRRTGLARLVELSHLGALPVLRPYHRVALALGSTAARLVPTEPDRPDLELFTGCMGGIAQGRATQAALDLLARLGLRARLPTGTACCGALSRHNGLAAEAERLRAACARPPGSPPLVGLSSACVAELREAPATADTWELCDFLDRQVPWERVHMEPIRERVLVHEPCSHRNLLGGSAAVYRLLERIPGLEVLPLPGNETCCGAAGTYMLDHPTMAEALLREKTVAIAPLRPTSVVTTNGGCALHLVAGLRDAGLAVTVCHPAELVARSVAGNPPSGCAPPDRDPESPQSPS